MRQSSHGSVEGKESQELAYAHYHKDCSAIPWICRVLSTISHKLRGPFIAPPNEEDFSAGMPGHF